MWQCITVDLYQTAPDQFMLIGRSNTLCVSRVQNYNDGNPHAHMYKSQLLG